MHGNCLAESEAEKWIQFSGTWLYIYQPFENPYYVEPPNLTKIRSVVCLQMCWNCTLYQETRQLWKFSATQPSLKARMPFMSLFTRVRLRSSLFQQMCGHCLTNHRPGNGEGSVVCDPKVIRWQRPRMRWPTKFELHLISGPSVNAKKQPEKSEAM